MRVSVWLFLEADSETECFVSEVHMEDPWETRLCEGNRETGKAEGQAEV